MTSLTLWPDVPARDWVWTLYVGGRMVAGGRAATKALAMIQATFAIRIHRDGGAGRN